MKKVFLFINIFVLIILLIPQKNDSLAVSTIIRAGYIPYYPPFQSIEKGEAKGLHIDLFNKIAEQNNFIVEYVPLEGRSKYDDAFKKGKIDVIIGVINNQNSKYNGMLTDELSQSYVSAFAKADRAFEVKQNLGEVPYIAVYETQSMGNKNFINNTTFLLADNQVNALDMLINERADLLIGNTDSIIYQLREKNIEENYSILNSMMTNIEYTVLVKDNSLLINQINEALNKMRVNGEYEELYNKWISSNSDNNYVLLRKVLFTILAALLIGLVVLAIIVRMNNLLKQKVAEQTKELRLVNSELEEKVIEIQNYAELQHRIVEENLNGIVVFDNFKSVTMINSVAKKLLEIEEDIIGKNLDEIPILNRILELNFLDFTNSEYIENLEIPIELSDEKKCYYKFNIYFLESNPESQAGVLYVENITESTRKREEIHEREKNKSLNRILTGIAHEIRNPLTSIKTFVEMIPQHYNNADFKENIVTIVPREIDRINLLIKNLMDYSKPSKNKNEIILVKDMLASCVALLKYSVEKENIILEENIENELIILVDRNRIRQSVINLLINCIDAVCEKNCDKKIVINAWQDDEFVYIQTFDQGIGMNQDEIQRATEPFFTTKTKGTGLGLYMVKQYIEQIDGKIEIDSRKNEFTKVTLKFRRI